MQTHGGSSASALWCTRIKPAPDASGGPSGALTQVLSQIDAPASLTTVIGEAIETASLEAAVRPALPVKPPPLPGFRHFKRRPKPEERFALDGKCFDPSNPIAWEHAERLMGKLATWCGVQPDPPPDLNNRGIPSGYTYFLQLVAHDLVHSSVLLSRNKGRLFALTNVRDMPLRLETIYGGGPAQCPHSYQSDTHFRHRLRLGSIRTESVDPDQFQLIPDQARDIARATPGTANDAINNGYSEALIADPRNDSHAIISQMVILFHTLHNTILDKLSVPPLKDDFANTERKFIAAHTACVMIYRAIIRRDLLPKILHPDVWRAYEEGTVPVLEAKWARSEWRAPLEMTHGFSRFAHAMIRPLYSLNKSRPFPSELGVPHGAHGIRDVLHQSSEESASSMPFTREWVIDWHRFFGDTAVNFSMLITPWVNPEVEEAVKALQQSKRLMERDLLSSIAVSPWSIRALVRELQKTHGDLLSRSTFFRFGDQSADDRPPWFESISDWLTKQASRSIATPKNGDIEQLADDPPIPFFVRFESGQDPSIGGKHLGILGSIIVADVIYGILQHDELLGIDGSSDLPQQLTALAKRIFDEPDVEHDKVFSFIGDVHTFPQLLTFLEIPEDTA
jgi:hypothetical protein